MTTRTSADDNPANGGPTRSWRLFLVWFAMLIVSLDQYIVVVALPDIGRALGYTAHTLQLVVSAYAVASSGFLLVGGRAADLLGQRRMLATGLVLYTVASLAGGLATGPATQLAARVVQGLGGALVFPATLAVVTTTYAEGRRAQPRARDLGCGRRGRAGGRCAARRRAHPLPRLVVGVLRQCAAGGRGAGSDFRRGSAGPPARPDPPVRPGRCADRDGRSHAGGLVPGAGPAARVDGRRSARPGGPRSGPRLGVHQDRAASPRPADASCPGPQPVRPPGSRALLPVHGHLRVAAVLRVDLSAERSAVRRAPDRPRVPRPHLRRRRGVGARRGGLHPDRPARDMSGGARRRCVRSRSPRRQPHRHRRLPRAPAGTSPGQHRRRDDVHGDLHCRRHRRRTASAGSRLRDRLHRIGDRCRRRSGAARAAGRPGPRQPRRGGAADRHCRRHPRGGVRDRRRDRRHAADRARWLPPPPRSRSRNRAERIGYRPT